MTTDPTDVADALDEVDRIDKEAEAIAAERIRSGAADQKEDGVKALEKLGISGQSPEHKRDPQSAEAEQPHTASGFRLVPLRGFEPRFPD